jgi:dihydroorotase
MHEGVGSACCGLPGIPAIAEEAMIARDLAILEETGGRYHVAHLSTRRALELVRGARRKGLGVTCEATPHHLLLDDLAVVASGFDARFKMNPPLRDARDAEALVAGLADGSIDAIATDHAPHTADEKALEFQLAPFGIVGLETCVALCLDRLVARGLVGLARLVELLSTGPARVLNLPGGTLAPGAPGDLSLLDLGRHVRVRPAGFASRARNTPFDGWDLVGAPAATVVAGRVVWRAE